MTDKKQKTKIAHNGKEALELLRKAKKGESILWDERTPCKVIHEWFTKTNSQQDLTHSEKSGLLQPADIHNREHKLKPQYNPLISSLKNFVLAYEQGIKEERERIMKIIRCWDRELNMGNRWKSWARLQEFADAVNDLEQEIKGDENV